MLNISVKGFLLLLISSVMSLAVQGQEQTLSLEECYQLARENYPLIKKLNLVEQTQEIDLAIVNKRYLPQVTLSGQATYQSKTMSFGDALGSLPAMNLPSIDKDQYRIQAELQQLLYDGGMLKNQKELIVANSAVKAQNLETSLYQIKQRINSLYFSILLMDAQFRQNEINKSSLETQIQKTEAALANGVAFRSNVDELKAEKLQIEMAGTEYLANKQTFLNTLSLFVGKEIASQTQLQIPQTHAGLSEINRPELRLFDQQSVLFDLQSKQLKSEILPQLNFFFQGAYGRPTLKMLENKFGPWYLTGIRFNWSLGGLYSLSGKKSRLQMDQYSLEADRETFLLQNKMEMAQENEQVKKFGILIRQDEEAIQLRQSVRKSAEAQLANGVITIHEYIQKLNAEHQAFQRKILHEIQYMQAQYNQKFISGN